MATLYYALVNDSPALATYSVLPILTDFTDQTGVLIWCILDKVRGVISFFIKILEKKVGFLGTFPCLPFFVYLS